MADEEPNAVSFASQFLENDAIAKEAAAARSRVLDQIERLDLQRHAWELEVHGFTVLEPERVGSTEFASELCRTAVAVCEKRLGQSIDVEFGKTHVDFKSPFGQVQRESTVLFEDQIFEAALMNEVVLAVVTYLLGESCTLVHQSLFVKGPGPDYLPLHTDQEESIGPAPYPPFAQVANATWALSDYTSANGAICFVQGSHKFCRAPTREEATNTSLFQPVEVPAGSVIVWHGNTWHGALPRTAPGLRISLVEFFGRWNAPMDPVQRMMPVPPEMLNRNPPRLATLLRVADPSPELDQLREVKLRAAKTSYYA
jgi:ectoine hydroxylase-related dioxygenase (phytanoyl-CoA dioxygenase family)